nr:uncharacterized protein LOC127486536 [Oryctolagus cuniculus]XP_051686511.1 uncharacterized protein LOC127486536 [Oryctolagus cuniculus]
MVAGRGWGLAEDGGRQRTGAGRGRGLAEDGGRQRTGAGRGRGLAEDGAGRRRSRGSNSLQGSGLEAGAGREAGASGRGKRQEAQGDRCSPTRFRRRRPSCGESQVSPSACDAVTRTLPRRLPEGAWVQAAIPDDSGTVTVASRQLAQRGPTGCVVGRGRSQHRPGVEATVTGTEGATDRPRRGQPQHTAHLRTDNREAGLPAARGGAAGTPTLPKPPPASASATSHPQCACSRVTAPEPEPAARSARPGCLPGIPGVHTLEVCHQSPARSPPGASCLHADSPGVKGRQGRAAQWLQGLKMTAS